MLRLVASSDVICDAIFGQPGSTEIEAVIVKGLASVGATLFMLGLGTPMVSMALAAVEVAFAFSFTGHLEKSILIGAIVLAIGVLGSGAICIDANSTEES